MALEWHRASDHCAPPHPHSPASPSSCFSQYELLDTELGYSWFTETEKRSYLKDERTTSNAPKGNCLVAVIYVTGLLATADAGLQHIWTGLSICSGSWCEMRDPRNLLVEEGKAWDGQRKLVFEIRHGLHRRRVISFEELFATLTDPQTMKSESKEGLEPGPSIRGGQNSWGGSGFAKCAQSPFDFAKLNHMLFRARTA